MAKKEEVVLQEKSTNKVKQLKSKKKQKNPETVSTEETTQKQEKGKKKVKVFKDKKKKDPENVLIEKLQSQYENIDSSSIHAFSDLPLSPKTLKGLKECGYTKPTDIQKETIRLALLGNDILGASHTGSGKTLAFLIPVLEKLFSLQWTRMDGLGALIITPTRELAFQIFQELRRIGEHHDFSAGLIIGGKDLHFEKHRIDQCNIIICTPGRLLQHMDENPLLNCVNMKILVLDEADRCLDMGFKSTMNAIIENLPPKRQTLLFSATQTKSMADLARLSLKDPSYVSVHEHAETSTPKTLQQSYVVCELKDKVSILWSFIKNHLKQKIIVFFSTCKQVKYMYEIFSKLRPGVPLKPLYGTLHQTRRMAIHEDFCNKSAAVLFATDIVARGLDFPEVHWVVQFDCPEDSDTYIHRVGRTARYHRGGETLLLLLPSEIAMIEDIKSRRIPIEKIEINPLKLINPKAKMEAFLRTNNELRETAKRAFVHYAKSVFLMKNKDVFKVESLDTDSFAYSLGLDVPPRIRFLERRNIRTSNLAEQKVNEEKDPTIKSIQMAYDNLDDTGFVTAKMMKITVDPPVNLENGVDELDKKKKPVTRVALAKKSLKNNIQPNKKIIFDDDGEVADKYKGLDLDLENADMGRIIKDNAKLLLKAKDKFNKERFKEKVKSKHKEEKTKLKAKRKKEAEEDKDDFDESDSEYEPDLSWMPDPDKIYGKKEDEDEEDEYKSESEQEVVKEKSKKRKNKFEEQIELPAKKKNKHENDSEYEMELSSGSDFDAYEEDSSVEMDDEKNSESEDDIKVEKSKKRKTKVDKETERPMKKNKYISKDLTESLNVNEAEQLAMMLLKNR